MRSVCRRFYTQHLLVVPRPLLLLLVVSLLNHQQTYVARVEGRWSSTRTSSTQSPSVLSEEDSSPHQFLSVVRDVRTLHRSMSTSRLGLSLESLLRSSLVFWFLSSRVRNGSDCRRSAPVLTSRRLPPGSETVRTSGSRGGNCRHR